MTGIWIAGVLGLGALLFVGIVLSRQSSRQKKKAVASLEAERASVTMPSILDLVNEEVEELGLRDLRGAEDIPPDILLRTWRDAPESLRTVDRDHLAFRVQPDADPTRLTVDDVELVADTDAGATASAHPDEAHDDPGDADG